MILTYIRDLRVTKPAQNNYLKLPYGLFIYSDKDLLQQHKVSLVFADTELSECLM